MTFKHVKFEDSPTMRALEKVAKEKGLVKPDAIQKTAQAGTDLYVNYLNNAARNLSSVYKIIEMAGGLSDTVLNWAKQRVDYVNSLINAPPSLNAVEKAISAVEALQRNLHPNMLHNYLPDILNKGVSQDVIWNKISPLLEQAHKNLTAAKANVTSLALQTKASLKPSDNLMENIFKLCSGLRNKGLVKEASEIEVNYLGYKKAQTLYETSKEKGEDLIHAAHPEGSHKMEDVEGDEAVFEDILDKHLKHVQVVEKQPTGKLSDASSIINKVKKSLGQFVPEQQVGQAGKPKTTDQEGQIKAKLDNAVQKTTEAYSLTAKVGGLTSIVLRWAWGRLQVVTQALSKPVNQITANDLDDADSAISAMERNLQPDVLHNILPSWLSKGISEDVVWDQVKAKLDAASASVQEAKGLLTSLALKTSSVKVVTAQVDPEALQQGKKALVQALQLTAKGLNQFLNVFYGQSLDVKKPGIDEAVRQANALAGKVQAVPAETEMPNQLMQDINDLFVSSGKWLEDLRKEYKGEGEAETPAVTDADWWRKFNYAASLMGQGTSMYWGATAAVNRGDLSGLKFHAAHLSSDEIANIININLIRPLQTLPTKIGQMGYAEKKSKLPADQLAKADAVVNEIDAAVKSAQGAVNNLFAQQDQNLRVIHPGKIAGLFTAPLDDTFKVDSLETLKQRCTQVVNIYNRNLNIIKSWLGE